MATPITKTIKAAGGDYASLYALAADSRNLVAAGEAWTVLADNIDDLNGTVPNFNGWVLSAECFLKIKAVDAHASKGTPTTNAYRRRVTSGSTSCATVTDIGSGGLLIFEDCQFENTVAGQPGILVTGTAGHLAEVRFIDCVFHTNYVCINAQTAASYHVSCINCTMDSDASIAFYCGTDSTGRAVVYKLYHCTLHGSSYGIYYASNATNVLTMQNSYISGATASYTKTGTGTANFNNTAASDANGNPAALDNIAYSTTNFVNVTNGSEDYTLKSGINLIEGGADLTAESDPFNVQFDLNGTRRKPSAPDVGALQLTEYILPNTGKPAAIRAGVALYALG